VLPDTRPNLVIGPDGVCNACRTHGRKPDVDWAARARDFAALAALARAWGSRHDCVIPVSGGKDSTWQTVVCLEHDLNPLAVTWRTPARTELGQRNLDNLVSLGVDHVDYTVDPNVEARFMLASFARFGTTAIPMHMALFNIPLTIAVRFRIPLVVWGENSAVEYGGEAAQHGFRLDRAWLDRFGVMHGTTAADWVSETLTERDLAPYYGPDDDELAVAGTHAVFLGHYFGWDPERSLAVAREHGFRPGDRARTGLYNYADIDDDLISIHHWLKWLKFGFTRTFDNLSLEIRNGRLTREQALDVLRRRGDETPHADIDRFCELTGIDRARFFEIAERFRNRDIWTRRDGTWVIEGFLVTDWDWSAEARGAAA
jgi:N-acetyl sugar amidotransferase